MEQNREKTPNTKGAQRSKSWLVAASKECKCQGCNLDTLQALQSLDSYYLFDAKIEKYGRNCCFYLKIIFWYILPCLGIESSLLRSLKKSTFQIGSSPIAKVGEVTATAAPWCWSCFPLGCDWEKTCYGLLNSRQHCRPTICGYFGWVWIKNRSKSKWWSDDEMIRLVY